MSNNCNLTEFVPYGWHDKEKNGSSLFYSPEWHGLLDSALNAKTHYLYNKNDTVHFAITVFRKGPFRIGYVNFPIGLFTKEYTFNNACLEILRREKLAHIVNLPIREKYSTEIPPSDCCSISPETIIMNLDKWDFSQLPKSVRRDVRKAYREPLELFHIDSSEYSLRLYKLYINTVKRQGGRPRYTRSYFNYLIDLAGFSKLLRLTGLRDDRNCLVAYLALAFHENTAFYLHGAMDINYKNSNPMYLLLADAIQYSSDNGMLEFNLMPSPPNQYGLIKFKEKWNASTFNNIVHSYHIDRKYSLAINMARSLERFLIR